MFAVAELCSHGWSEPLNSPFRTVISMNSVSDLTMCSTRSPRGYVYIIIIYNQLNRYAVGVRVTRLVNPFNNARLWNPAKCSYKTTCVHFIIT